MERDDMTDFEKAVMAAGIEMQKVELLDAAPSVIRTWQARRIVRSVLMAVREPEDATVTRACDRGYYSAPDLEIHFGAMIDAILADGEGR